MVSQQLLEKVEKMINEGATFIDIGGHSTRPNAPAVDADEEERRVLPSIKAILAHFPEAIISIDTFRASIAQKAVEAGAAMVNDVSGGLMDTYMYETVAELNVPYVLMHMRGTVYDMLDHTHYDNLIYDVFDDLEKRIAQLRGFGQKDIIVDIGYGFAKTADQNYQLLNKMELFHQLDCPILTGLSRKSMIWRKLGIEASQALNGTTVLNTVALLKGSQILRVHDVKEALEAVKLVTLLQNSPVK